MVLATIIFKYAACFLCSMDEEQTTLGRVPSVSPLISSKTRLAMELSSLAVFEESSIALEQYPMDSEIGAEVLWDADFKGDIEGKVIADFGCGTGILGIGALLLKAGHVFFVDNDENVFAPLKQNLGRYPFFPETHSFHHAAVADFDQKADVVIQNPPFGTKKRHADRDFLLKAFATAPVIYTFHKATSREFIAKISDDHGFAVTHYYEFDFPLKMEHLFHRRRIHRIKVGCWRLEKKTTAVGCDGHKLKTETF